MSIEEMYMSFNHWEDIQPILKDLADAGKEKAQVQPFDYMEDAMLDGLLTPCHTARSRILGMYHGGLTPVQCLQSAFADSAVIGSPSWTRRGENALALIDAAIALSYDGKPCFEKVTKGASEYDPSYMMGALKGLCLHCFDELAIRYEDASKIDLRELLSMLRDNWKSICDNRAAYIAAMECCKLMGNDGNTPYGRTIVRISFLMASRGWPAE